MSTTKLEPALRAWLLDTDPALRWQVERDLIDAPPDEWMATRSRVATEGFGARLLALQDPDGQWAGGAYFPKSPEPGPDPDPDPEPVADEGQDEDHGDDGGQPWTATTWSLNALREWGVEGSVLAGTAEKLAAHSRWEYDDLPYWGGEVDCCINGYTLANGVWLGADVTGLAQWFLDHQMADGGWNCEWVEGSTRSSFHSTLNTLKGLLYYEKTVGGSDLYEARRAGQEYLLERRLLRSLSTGEQVGDWATLLAYPFRWIYSALNALDHFREAALHDGSQPDERLADAIETIRAKRQPDGAWLQEYRHPGQAWFEVDVPPGEPSPWLTFFALRVLAWWDGRTSA